MPLPPDYSQDARTIFLHAVEAVHPYALVKRQVQLTGGLLQIAGEGFLLEKIRHIYITGAGKATAAMAKAIEDTLSEKITGGTIIVKYGHTEPLTHITTVEAAHPVPDENGLHGTAQILHIAKKATEDDLVINLISGGGSALLIDLPNGCTLGELQQCYELLLRSGASIEEINTVRKHLSGVKGGQLAKAVYPATLVTLILSDVIGDPLDVIASGPTVADPTTYQDAWQVLDKYRLQDRISTNIRLHLQKGLEGNIPDTPKPDNIVFRQARNHIIGSNAIALKAAADKARQMGFHTNILGANISGDALQTAIYLVTQARQMALDNTIAKPLCLLMGGETTVVVTGKGKGGRNQHLALAAALRLKPEENITILSAGTDGSDGPTDAAGAVVDGKTVHKAAKKGIQAQVYFDNNDSYHFFSQAGGHIITGPTMTNVMDIMLAMVY
jgi:glycerate 2-kinase